MLTVHPISAVGIERLEELMMQLFDGDLTDFEEGEGSEDEVDQSMGAASPTFIMPPATTTTYAPLTYSYIKRQVGDAGKITEPPQKKAKRTPAKQKRYDSRKAKQESNGRTIHPKFRAKLINPTIAVPTVLSSDSLPATLGGYQGRRIPKNLNTPAPGNSLSELLERGYKVISWDGQTARPLLDSTGRVFGVLAGRPDDPEFLGACTRFFDAMQLEASQAVFTPNQEHHVRGDYPAAHVGITPGQGSKYPTLLSGGHHRDMIERLLKNEDLKRIASYHDSALCMWSPALYKHMWDRLSKLYGHPSFGLRLERIFKGSIYPAATFNFGPNVWTKRHRDTRNCAFGWCAVQALGNFDKVQGGHLILEDLQLLIEFPPGSAILFPSATLTHANIPIQPHETCGSFTQYCPGGLLHFVDNDFCTGKALKKNKSTSKAYQAERKQAWIKSLSLWWKLDELADFVD